MTECVVCKRRTLSAQYCEYHEIARTKLLRAYEEWNRAFGGMGWERYLETLGKIEGCGDWVKQLVRYEHSKVSSKRHGTIS